MEEEKRKRKSKKKKGKQNKPSEDVTVAGVETRSVEQNHAEAGSEQNHRTHIFENANIQLAGASESDVKQDRDHIDVAKGVIRNEAEKQLWLLREADLEKKVIDLQHEKDSWSQTEASMEEKIKQLLHEKSNWILKEASFEDRIKQLEKDSESWVFKEISNKEAIARMNEQNMEALTQVKGLQESRDSVFQENRRLMEVISVLQSQVQQLERESSFSASSMAKMHVSEVEDMNAQLEAASMLVEKLITENADLVEKVNELYIELNRQSKVVEHSSMTGHDSTAVASQTTLNGLNSDCISELQEKMPDSSKGMELQTVLQTKTKNINVDHSNDASTMLTGLPSEYSMSYEAGDTEEIVQIPLDENEIEEVKLLYGETDEKVGVPISDAPLTGAPFRLISFVARYVSGADLVDKNSSNSVR